MSDLKHYQQVYSKPNRLEFIVAFLNEDHAEVYYDNERTDEEIEEIIGALSTYLDDLYRGTKHNKDHLEIITYFCDMEEFKSWLEEEHKLKLN